MSDNIVTMPKLGETVTEGTIGSWLKQVGDPVAFDDPLFEVSTDKVDSEIPSPYDGVLLEILVPSSETVPVGTPLARIGAPESAAAQAKPRPQLSPVVRRLARENGIDLTTVNGTGAAGRVRREDVQQAIAARRQQPEPVAQERDTVVALSRMRLVTAQRMVESLQISAHVWSSSEVDFERIEQLRREYGAPFQAQTGVPLTYLPFVARAVCDALRACPAVNASIDIERRTMTLHRYVHLGIAVDVAEQGLLAPVVMDADGLNIRGIAREIARLAAAARAGELPVDSLRGSTFTITNPGPFGTYASAPIINQPNVGILALDGIARRPTAVGDAIAIHHTGLLGLSYDHRAFDGSTAARFLQHVRESLEQRDWAAELA
jgi:pyruvate dehydrogenase E2 component (dihydrolipoamide acetyltransferase)